MDNLLPTEIQLDILSRLPAESVVEFKRVCKQWRTILSRPSFAHMHLRQSLQFDQMGILYLHGQLDGYVKKLYYGEYDENDEESYKTLTRMNHPRIKGNCHLVDSCNGLICFSVNRSNYRHEFIYICNPITREYINLPSCNTDIINDRDSIIEFNYGFGYSPSTNEYKVLRILCRLDHKTLSADPVGCIQVYTLGAGTGWRNKGEITNLLSWYCVFANGALYWLDETEMKIVAFDLAAEEFHLIPSPPWFVHGLNESFQLRVLGRQLCVVHISGRSENIGSLKKYRVATYVIKEPVYQSWSWHREFVMEFEGLDTDSHDMFAFTKKGEVLLWVTNDLRSIRYLDSRRHSVLWCYDPKAATVKKRDTEMLFHVAIPHMNSFVSLKALGEDAKVYNWVRRRTS